MKKSVPTPEDEALDFLADVLFYWLTFGPGIPSKERLRAARKILKKSGQYDDFLKKLPKIAR